MTPPSGLFVRRSDGVLYAKWEPSDVPNLRYYELQIDNRDDFSRADIVKTPDPYHAWTWGLGAQNFYFYVRVRSVGLDQRVGEWSPKFEAAVPDRSNISPQSGVLTLNRRTDVFQVGGGATTITQIKGGWIGRCVTLYFVVAHTVQDNSGIRLSGDFSATADSTLTLRYLGDPYGWVEVSRITSI